MSESPTLENSVQQVNQINILSHDDKGVTIRNVENLNMKARKRGRNIPKGTDLKIYVNDGSFGSNLHYVKGQRAYALKNEKTSPQNSYSNNFPQELTTSRKVDEPVGTKLHKYGESGGYHLFTYPTLRSNI